MAPGVLKTVLSNLQGWEDPAVLVGYQTADDGGVYRLSERLALVQTVDFFTPVVDDPFQYGQIAAANALSDVYAMGGEPRFALSIVGFPKSGLDTEILRQIMAGGSAKLAEARVAVMGGHSVQDPEIKFGYCVTGVVDADAYWTNAAAQAGDVLLLTKPLGTGIITTGVKFEKTPSEALDAALEVMLRLNDAAARAAASYPVHSATDVTGFGLLGHAFEMAQGSGRRFRLRAGQVPLIPGTQDLARLGMLPGGIESNRAYVGDAVQWHSTPLLLQQILLDPQTSGGLLFSLPPAAAEQLLDDLERQGHQAAIVGEVLEKDGETSIEVLP